MPLSIFNHPFLFAAVAVVAIGVAVYEILSSQEENKRRYKQGRRSPTPSPKRKPPPSPSSSPKRKPTGSSSRPPSANEKPSGSSSGPPLAMPPSKSNEMSDSTVVSYSNSSGNNLRKRNLDQSLQKEQSSIPGSGSPKGTSSSDVFGSPPESNKISNDSTAGPYSNSPGNDLRNLDLDQSSPKEKYLDDSKKSPSLGQNSSELKTNSSFDSSRPPSKQCNETSSDLAVELYSKSSVNNLGTLNFDQTLQKKSFPSDLKNSTEFTPMTAEKELNETPFIVNSENTPDKKFDEKNYCKNLLDKLSDDTKNVHKKNILKQNIYKEESDSSENNLFPESEEKLLNKTSNSGSQLTENSSGSDMKICKAQNDDHGCNEDNFPSSSSTFSSSQQNKLEKISESNLCKSCEEGHINVQAYPCNHSYLCVECAIKIFRIYKKCSVCLQDVEEFVQIST